MSSAAVADPFVALTLGQIERARATDDQLICRVMTRLHDDEAVRIGRMSPAELALLADLERAAT